MLLSVDNLGLVFEETSKKRVVTLERVSFNIQDRETLALVGESGSGKTVTALSILQLLPYTFAYHTKESSIQFKDYQLCHADERTLRSIRGNRIGMIFQEPLSAFNPLHTI